MLGALLCLSLAAAPLPSLEDAARRHGPAMVGVWAGDDAGHTVRPGFFVASSGVVVTVLPSSGDVVVELATGDRRKGRVLVRDDDGLALVEVERLDKDAHFASLAVVDAKDARAPTGEAWVLALSFVDGRASPALGGVRRVDGARWRMDLPVDAGAAVLSRGRVVGVVVQRAGTTSSVAVPASRITELARRIPSG